MLDKKGDKVNPVVWKMLINSMDHSIPQGPLRPGWEIFLNCSAPAFTGPGSPFTVLTSLHDQVCASARMTEWFPQHSPFQIARTGQESCGAAEA